MGAVKCFFLMMLLCGDNSIQPASLEANNLPKLFPTPGGGANILFAPERPVVQAMCFGGTFFSATVMLLLIVPLLGPIIVCVRRIKWMCGCQR